MIETLQKVGSSDPNAVAGQGGDAAKTPPVAASSNAQGATRLYVEQNGAGGFVYRIVDTVTGRVLAEVPREQADQLKTSPDYAAGALVSTSA